MYADGKATEFQPEAVNETAIGWHASKLTAGTAFQHCFARQKMSNVFCTIVDKGGRPSGYSKRGVFEE